MYRTLHRVRNRRYTSGNGDLSRRPRSTRLTNYHGVNMQTVFNMTVPTNETEPVLEQLN